MDEQLLRERMTAAVDGEPPLGLDPERAADEAIRRSKRRRATIGSGVATVAVVGAVAVLPGVTGSGGGQQLAPAASSSTSGGAESGRPHPGQQRIDQLARHAVEKVSELRPQARDVRASEAKYVGGGEKLPAHLSITVAFVDSQGPAAIEIDVFPDGVPGGVNLGEGDSFQLRGGKRDGAGSGDGDASKGPQGSEGDSNASKTGELSPNPSVRQLTRERADGSVVYVAAGAPEDASREQRMRESPVMPRWQLARIASDSKFRLDR
ncbi:hypothetical protein [Actinopolyspora saharensis]|uniref:hypothetical protein n=1 Tax=Actinopolyspora saharensis TaxID=995062 RepID=UPI003F6756CA